MIVDTRDPGTESAGRLPATPKYSAVARILFEDIRTGQYKPGDLLPSEPELSRRFGVSRHTVRAALRSLYEKGLIVSRQGHGSVVQDAAATPRYRYACNSIEDVLQYAAATPRRVLGTRRIELDAGLAAWLGCEPGYPWWELHTCRDREVGGPVVASSLVYVPDAFSDVVAELEQHDLPLFVLMEQRHGCQIAQIRQGISVAAANAVEAADLGLTPGTPVMCVERRFFDERGGLLEVSRTAHPPDTFHYEMTLRQVIGR